jgi:hypothetical protein
VLTKHVSQIFDRMTDFDVSDRSIRRALNSLAEIEVLTADSHDTDGRKRVWSEAGLSDMADVDPASYEFPEIDTDVVDTEAATPTEKADISRMIIHTRSVRIPGESTSRASASGAQVASGGEGRSGAPPPDSAQSD